MQYELRQRVIAPRRQTFTNLIDRYGDRPATRYQEGSIDVQPTENFHYRPLWDPEHELYDVEFSALRLTDPYSFTDPRQYYYAPYVTARAQLHDAFLKTLDYIDERGLIGRMPESWKQLIGLVVVPLRHYESGAQLVTIDGARFSYGTTIEQCLTYAAFDRVGNAQMLSRLGIALGDATTQRLVAAKEAWTGAEHQQGLRRLVEELLVERDWAVATVGLDLADQLLYPLLYQYLDEVAVTADAGAYSLIAQHLSNWFTEHRRWLDALYQAWLNDPEHGESNRAVLAGVVWNRLPQAVAAVHDLAEAIDADTDAGAVAAAKTIATDLVAVLVDRGLSDAEELA